MDQSSRRQKKHRQKLLLLELPENEWEDILQRLLFYTGKKHYYKFANRKDLEDIVDEAILLVLASKRLVKWTFEDCSSDVGQIKKDVLNRLRCVVDDLVYKRGRKSRRTVSLDELTLEEPASTSHAPFVMLAYDLTKLALVAPNRYVKPVTEILIENAKITSRASAQDVADRLEVKVDVVYNVVKWLKRHLLKREMI